MNWPGKTLNATNPDHQKYMKLALRTAEKGRGGCAPNPFVGAVIVKDGQVIATGWTQHCGGDHAEVQALKKAGSQARGADLYVTLEPCSHHGKTPPCAKAVIAAGIRRVFAGVSDPNPLVAGKGFALLAEAGIEVQTGFLETEIRRQLEYHLCRIEKKRPFVIWKAALSLDGKYAAQDGSSQWITNERSRRQVHRLREEADAVLTGIGTVLADDPLLNVRLPRPKKQPLRVVLDPGLDIDPHSKLIQSSEISPILLFCARGRYESPQASKLAALGAEIIPVAAKGDELDLKDILAVLHARGCYCVLLECGSRLASAFFSARLVDKCIIFYGPLLLGGQRSVLSELPLASLSQALQLRDPCYKRLGDDWQVSGYPVFP